LEVAGKVDLDSERGRSVWGLIKANSVGFSFGYLATDSRPGIDGGRELLEIDVFENSVTPSPMNNRTRVLSAKSIDVIDDDVVTDELVAAAADAMTKRDDDELVATKAKRLDEQAPVRIARFEG